MPGDTADLDDIAEHLVMLHKEGLNACEDPAYIPLGFCLVIVCSH